LIKKYYVCCVLQKNEILYTKCEILKFGGIKNMNSKKILEIAGVLLLSALMLIPAAAVANTDTNEAAVSLHGGVTKVTTTGNTNTRDVLFDNGLPNGVNGVSCGVWPSYDREIIDDFTNTESWDVTGGEYRIVTYYSGTSIDGTNVKFFEDVGGPSTTEYATAVADITCTLTGDYYFSRPEILVTCSFDAITLPAGTWWVCFQPVYSENMFWLTADGQGSSIYLAYPEQGYNRWTDGYVVFAAYYDTAFLLTGGGGGGDTTPPVTTAEITGTNPVTITLTATDDDSGVNYTMYKIDDGTYATYTGPVQVTEVGDHIVYFYSVDNEGNVETEKSESFTVEAPALTITIAGGLGVSATIKNTGTETLTDIDWTINLDGSLIFIGKTKSGTIASLAAGEAVTVKDFVIGLGKTNIAVTAGESDASAAGTVLLFFVIGVA
jgi:hypothetical protein